MITILHNNRCSKSREAMQILEEKNVEHQVRYYLENPLSEAELRDLLIKLKKTPLEIIRTNEAIWKENYKGKNLSDDELIQAIVENPKLLQRPILIKGDEAIVGRPTEIILDFIQQR